MERQPGLFQPVAHPIDGVDDLGILQLFGQLLAQVFDVAVHRSVTDHTAVGVHLVHELPARKHPAGLAQQRLQQAEFHRRELQGCAVDDGPETVFIQRDAAIAVNGFTRCIGCHRLQAVHH
jgi:hypothetical protein